MQGPHLLTSGRVYTTEGGPYEPVYTNVMVELLPYIEQQDLQTIFDKSVPTGNSKGPNTGEAGDSDTVAAQVITNFRCPSTHLPEQNVVSPGFIFGSNDYAGNGGAQSTFPTMTGIPIPRVSSTWGPSGITTACSTLSSQATWASRSAR